MSPPDVFASPVPAYTHGYTSGYAPPPPTHLPVHSVDIALSSQHYGAPYASGGSMHSYSSHSGGGGGGFTPIYTDDAATKLSDRVRRRCFNCCTTDTSTWRRSSLNPGKVVSWTSIIFSHLPRLLFRGVLFLVTVIYQRRDNSATYPAHLGRRRPWEVVRMRGGACFIKRTRPSTRISTYHNPLSEPLSQFYP